MEQWTNQSEVVKNELLDKSLIPSQNIQKATVHA